MQDVFSLKSRRVLVTGASSGIGRSIAQVLSNAGAQVILVGRNRLALEETYSLLEGSGHQIYCLDITEEESVSEFISEFSPLDGIVHAAGMIKRFPLKFMAKSSFRELLDVNLFAASEITRVAVKRKKIVENGSIVFISSVGSDYASLGNIMYMASKGAVNSMVKGMALELASKKIRVNAVQPGLVVTNLTKQINKEELAIQLKNYPLGRFGLPVDVAYACLFLLSEGSSWMTGSFLKLDGGLTLR